MMKKETIRLLVDGLRSSRRFFGQLLQREPVSFAIMRTVAVFLMIALLSPVFLFNPVWKTSAQTNLPIPAPAPISAPPKPFLIAGNSSLSNSISSVFGSFLSFSGETISKYFSSPKTPAGLEQPENQLTLAENPVSENNNVVNNNLTLLTLPTGSVRYDFDYDGKADIARWHASNQEWKVKNSSSGNYTTTTIGTGSSIIAPGDFDGDGYTDPAVFNAGTWTIKKSSDGQTLTVSFGASGDKPVVGNYDNDSKADCAVFRPSTNTWWILKSTDNSYTSTSFGVSGDITAQGNFDGDSYTDIAVFRPSTGDWHVLGSTAGYFSFHWGIATDIPVPADFDGDGKTDFAVYRGSTGTWYAAKSSTSNAQYTTQVWGNYGDQPVPADYDGDGKDDFAVWRPTTGIWYIIKSSNGGYDYPGLGVAGDTAISSAYLKQIGGYIYSYDFAKTRLSPKNATGGTDLYSRNFSWGTGLVGLSGRAGMGAGFGISYNSLVWTKDTTNNAIVFNADNSNLTPGFRFGFPTIEPIYYDGQTGKFSYLMMTPSGARVEFRQTAASGVYETADSSYTQLKINGSASPNDPAESLTITVIGTDGTNMLYEWKNGAYRCQKVTDRNGNFITINHDANGLLQTLTDTLGRVITVNYNSDNLPSSITQTWKDTNGSGSNVTHTYATFTYTTQAINTNFSGSPTIVGPGDGYSLKVLQKITFPTETNGAGPNTVFTYNTWGQVTQVTNYAADNSQLNYVKVNLPADASSSQSDCPRFTETRNWVENFNLDQNNTAQETIVTNSITENATYDLPENITGSATKIEVSMTSHPHSAVSKIFVGSSGWREGLPIATEDWANGISGSERKRWTWANWTQDDTNLSYIQNPRVIESKVGDTTNTKRTTTDYRTIPLTTVAEYGLVSAVYVYDTDQATILKKVETDYNLSSAYLSRRIIGLPSEVRAYGKENSSLNLVSKVSYNYDAGNFNDTSLEQNPSITQHDTNFGASFITGRGNLTSTTRYDVSGQTSSVSSSVKYNTAGAPVAQTDSLNLTVKISYADQFNDGNNSRNTYAYPTKLTDPAGNYTEAKFRFDIGANIWAKSPTPQGTNNTKGKETERLYDSSGRLEREALVNHGGAYTRYEYPANGIQSKVFSTVIDTNNNGADTSDEVYSERWTDGVGRVRRLRSELPNSTGGWTGRLVEYDILGQVRRLTVPTEISPSPNNSDTWTPSGDDNRGLDTNNNPVWLWKSRENDWKGRVTREINTDGTDRLTSYDGCGCAGGEKITSQGELLPNPSQPGTFVRRKQIKYADILGRIYKTENYNWDGTVYSTTKKVFNGRDQETLVRHYAGTDSSTDLQDITTQYDGFGRVWKTHKPEQRDSNGTSTYTTYAYNADDSIQSVMDARGASTSYTYNNLGLPTNVAYSGSNIPSTSSLTFTYDNTGNRTSMSDGVGTVSYGYDELSRLKFETRVFSDTLTDTTVPSNGFRIEYNYTLGGQLKSYKDPYNREFQFTFDRIGRNTAVTGTTAYAGITNYSSNSQYRSFGSLKQISYGNQTTATMTYNNRLQPNSYRLNDATQTLFGKDYFYTTPGNNDNDGLLKKSVHYDNTMTANEQAKRNQLNTYDSLGRIAKSETGEEGLTSFGNYRNGPFQQTYSYNAFGNVTVKADRDFGTNIVGCTGCPRTISYSESIVNNRTQNSIYYASDGNQQSVTNYQYDNDGRLVSRNDDSAQFDATGKLVVFDSTGTAPDDYYNYGGDGDLLKWSQTGSSPTTTYYVKSSVFDANMLELNSTGEMSKEFVFSASGSKITYLKDNEVIWLHEEASGKESYEIKQDGTARSKTTYDPSSAAATNNGYSGGGSCPPSSCYSPENNAMLAQTHRGFDGLERLTQWRNAQWLQSHQFKILKMGLEGIWRRIDGNNSAPPPPDYDPQQLPDDETIYIDSFGTHDTFEFFFFEIINVEAKTAFEEFLKEKPGCAALAKKLGLDKVLSETNNIIPDEKLLNTSLKDLGFPNPNPADQAYQNKVALDRTLRQEILTGAVSNPNTNTIYWKGKVHADGFGFVAFHELLHLHFKGNHIAITNGLGLTASRTLIHEGKTYIADVTDPDAVKILYEFMKNDCTKVEKKEDK